MGRYAVVRWFLYLLAMLALLAWDISVSIGTWWAMVQQHEAGWRRRQAFEVLGLQQARASSRATRQL